MQIRFYSFVSIVLIAGCALHARAQQSISEEAARLNQWFDQRFEEQLDFSPMQKSRLGRKDDYGLIDDFSEAASDRQLQWRRDTVAELKNQFDYELLTSEAKISYDLWLYQLQRAEAASQFRRRHYLFNQMGGLHTSLPQFLITVHRVDTEADMIAYINRIKESARAIQQQLHNARQAASEGVHAPRFAYTAAVEQARAIITGKPFSRRNDATASALWSDANAKVETLVENSVVDAKRASQLMSEVEKALTGKFKSAYEELIEWAESELPQTDKIVTGVWKLPQGREFYQDRLLQMTTTSMTADAIHELGLSEVARIRAEMEAIMEQVEFEGDLQGFFEFVRTDPQFLFPNTDEGRQAYLDQAREHLDFIDQRLPQYFGLLPKAKLEVRRVEAFRERAGQAQHYQEGTPDGSRPGIFYVHLIDMASMPKPQLEVIAYHEGNPGHHMQISIAQELTNLPEFRKIEYNSAYGEGWGLYSEKLAKEMGAYRDPYSDFGRLSTEIWRAIRLVVDTGMHAKGWTEQQAVDYFTANSPISAGQIRSEVRRYLVWPGQAASYKIGMIKIQQLRARAQQTLGDDFDIREFHDTILGGGSLPLSILERRVDNWINSKLSD